MELLIIVALPIALWSSGMNLFRSASLSHNSEATQIVRSPTAIVRTTDSSPDRGSATDRASRWRALIGMSPSGSGQPGLAHKLEVYQFGAHQFGAHQFVALQTGGSPDWRVAFAQNAKVYCILHAHLPWRYSGQNPEILIFIYSQQSSLYASPLLLASSRQDHKRLDSCRWDSGAKL